MSLFARFATWWSEQAGRAASPEDTRGEEPPGLTIDTAGWIHGDGVIHMPSARGRGTLPAGGPTSVVRHGTATAWGTAAAIARSWRSTVENHSAHVTIDVVTKAEQAAEVARWRKLGWHAEAAQLAALPVGAAVLYQHRSLLDVAWHAAGSIVVDGKKVTTSGTVNGQGLNQVAIGIEMTCVGQIARKKDAQWRGWALGKGVGYGPAVPDDQVEMVGSKAYHRYPEPALAMERDLDAALLARFPQMDRSVTVTPSAHSIAKVHAEKVVRPAMAVGHRDVDPTRKEDPYPTGVTRGRPA